MKILDLRTIDEKLYNCSHELHCFHIGAINSINIAFIGIDRKNAQLFVQFQNSKSYMYNDISNGVFSEMPVRKEDLGKWLADYVKGNFSYSEVPFFVELANMQSVADKMKELQHEYDTTRGLWCTDKEPEDKTLFFQLK